MSTSATEEQQQPTPAAPTTTQPGEESANKEQQQPASGKSTKPSTANNSGRQTPRAATHKPGAGAPSPTTAPAAPQETDDEKAARLKREEEEELMIRPWKSPAKPSILRKPTKEEEETAATSTSEVAKKEGGGDNNENKQHHHIAFKDGQAEVFADHIFASQSARTKRSAAALIAATATAGADGSAAANSPDQQQQQQQQDIPEIDDVCERLYAEAIAKRRLKEEASRERQRELLDEEHGFDEECTFHPVIAVDAAKIKYENWDQFMQHRADRNKQINNRWTKKKAQLVKEARDKELGEERKMAPMSEKLLAYKAKKGQPHRGPITDYDKYLGKFILKKTTPEKGLNQIESGDDSARALPDPTTQRELTERLYDDAVARVAARQVIERARHAADRAKLFQPMTNERLIAKLKELNPDADNDTWMDDANVETRLLSQGESYRLRNERRRNQHELESLKDCTFTPRTNPKSRQLLQNWARRVENGDPAANQSVMMRVDRNLDQDGDYAPISQMMAAGGRVYLTEADALAALEQDQQQQHHNQSNSSNHATGGGNTSNRWTNDHCHNNNNSNSNINHHQQKPKHIPDPDGYFDKIKMRQSEKARQMAEKRRQLEQSKEEGCTFRPAMAPLTIALAKIRDDKEFGSAPDSRKPTRDREILMPPHLRAKTAQWDVQKGSPRKYPRGASNSNNNNNDNNSSVHRGSGSVLYDANGYPMNSNQNQFSAARSNFSSGSNNNSAINARSNYQQAASSSSQQQNSARNNNNNNSYHSDPYHSANTSSRNNNNNQNSTRSQYHNANNNNHNVDSSEHFLADLENELEGVISNWQSTEGM